MACEKCGARHGHRKGCPTQAGQVSDRGRARGSARGRNRGLMKGSRPRICRTCDGSGSKDGKVCKDCDGSGEKR